MSTATKQAHGPDSSVAVLLAGLFPLASSAHHNDDLLDGAGFSLSKGAPIDHALFAIAMQTIRRFYTQRLRFRPWQVAAWALALTVTAQAQAPLAVYIDHLDNGFQNWGWATLNSYTLFHNPFTVPATDVTDAAKTANTGSPTTVP